MDGSNSLLIRTDSSLALRCRKGAIHPILDHLVGAGEHHRRDREAERLSSCSASSIFAIMSLGRKLAPVILPPGRFRLSTRPVLIGVVAALAATAALFGAAGCPHPRNRENEASARPEPRASISQAVARERGGKSLFHGVDLCLGPHWDPRRSEH